LTLVESRWLQSQDQPPELAVSVACHSALLYRDIDWSVLLVDDGRIFAETTIESHLLGQSESEQVVITTQSLGDLGAPEDLADIRIVVLPQQVVALPKVVRVSSVEVAAGEKDKVPALELQLQCPNIEGQVRLLARVTGVSEQGYVVDRWLVEAEDVQLEQGRASITQIADLQMIDRISRFQTVAVAIPLAEIEGDPVSQGEADTIQRRPEPVPVVLDADADPD
jgi:hypothetical protein